MATEHNSHRIEMTETVNKAKTQSSSEESTQPAIIYYEQGMSTQLVCENNFSLLWFDCLFNNRALAFTSN